MPMVEEGVVSVLSSLARGSETKTRRVCAVILQNLSATKACRVEMVSRNCVQVAYELSSDQDPIVLRCIGITLARLAQEEANCTRMINEGGISALYSIAIKYPTVPGISQTVATAMQLISSHTKLQFSLVSDGSVTAIASLLRLSTDIITLQQSLLALCNVLSSKDTHLYIVQQGMLSTLMNLSEHENELMRSLCTLAFLNLSANEDSYKHIVHSGAIGTLIRLCGESSPVIRRRCSAALCNLSNYDTGIQRMISDDVIPALVKLMETKDVETMRNVCATFCRLCSTIENGKLILESGGIPHVIQGALQGDSITQQYCGSVLSVLSAYDSCRVDLTRFGVMDALTVLSELDDSTKQRCLVAFANLSCEYELHEEMIEKGVISIISKLVNSYQELNQICCATAICNLAYVGSRLRILKEGGLQALLMISMVRSVNNHTKMLCVVALGNLFEDSTMEFLLNEGLVGAVANLCKVPDDAIANLSAKMFNQFSLTESGRLKLIEKSNILVTLFQLMKSSVEETRVICAHTVSNLVMSESVVRQKCIKFGALDALSLGMKSSNSDESASLHCIMAVNSIALVIQFRWIIARTKLPENLLRVAMESTGEKYDRCAKIFCMLAWASGSRYMLQNADIMRTLMSLVTKNLPSSSVLWISLSFQYLTFLYYDHLELIEMGIVTAIQTILTIAETEDAFVEEVYQSTVYILRSMLETSQCIPYLANEGTLDVFLRIILKLKDTEILYNIAVSLYKFSEYSGECRHNISGPLVVDIMQRLVENAQCIDLLAVMIFLFCNDNSNIEVFTNVPIVSVCAKIIEESTNEGARYNVINALYFISKNSTGRALLSGPPANIDMKLMTLLKKCSSGMRACCSRVLKNLSSDASEELEDGAVAALIALSFDSKINKQQEVVDPPIIVPVDTKSFKAPLCSRENIKIQIYEEKHTVQRCGDVGKGPKPPEPPIIGFEGAKDIPNIMDEIESGDTNDGRTLMTFAKMHIPQALKENYLMTDADFELHRDEESIVEEYSWEAETSNDENTSFAPVEAKPVLQEPIPDSPPRSEPNQSPDISPAKSMQANNIIPKTVPNSKESLPLKEIASQHGLY